MMRRRQLRKASGRRRSPILVTVAYVVVLAFIVDAFLWPELVPHDPLHQNLLANLHKPGGVGGLFGTDGVGRDEFSRVLAGVRPVLEIVAASVAIGAVVGLAYGLLAGISETWVGATMARFVDMMLSIPGIVFAILLAFVLRPGTQTSIIVIAVVTWPGLARLVRAEVLQVRHAQYVELGTVAGLSSRRSITYHVLPNILNAFVAFVVLDAVVAIQLEAGLSFLGYGVQPPIAELGSMLAQSLTYLNQWWLAVFPGLALTILILAITYVGQDVRDRLDPRLAREADSAEPALEAASADTRRSNGAIAPSPAPVGPVAVGASTAPALRVTDLTVVAERTGRRIVDGVSLELHRGRVLAVVGESGSGKSTLCLAIIGLLTTGLRTAHGVVEYDDQIIDLAQHSAPGRLRPLRGKSIGLVLQDPLASLDPMRKVGFQLVETRVTHGLSHRRGRAARAEHRSWETDKLRALGFSRPAHTAAAFPSALSGGMRQRICIGIASAAGPRVVVADEPTTALDASLRGRVLRLLLDMGRSDETALVFVTHDLPIVESIADEVIVMYGGMVLEQGTRAEVFARPRSPYTQALLACSVTLDQAESGEPMPAIEDRPLAGPQEGCPFVARCPRGDDLCRTQRPVLEAVSPQQRVACWHQSDEPAFLGAGGSRPGTDPDRT